jgi:hypothetical protein
MSQSNAKAAQDFIVGLLIALGLNLLVFPMVLLGVTLLVNLMIQAAGLASDSMAFSSVLYTAIYGFPLLQLLYQVPIMGRFRRRGRPEIAKGMFVGVILSILTFGSCNVLVGALSSPPPSFLILIIAVSIGLPLAAAVYLFKRRSS